MYLKVTGAVVVLPVYLFLLLGLWKAGELAVRYLP